MNCYIVLHTSLAQGNEPPQTSSESESETVTIIIHKISNRYRASVLYGITLNTSKCNTMKGTKVQTLGANAVAGAWLAG